MMLNYGMGASWVIMNAWKRRRSVVVGFKTRSRKGNCSSEMDQVNFRLGWNPFAKVHVENFSISSVLSKKAPAIPSIYRFYTSDVRLVYWSKICSSMWPIDRQAQLGPSWLPIVSPPVWLYWTDTFHWKRKYSKYIHLSMVKTVSIKRT